MLKLAIAIHSYKYGNNGYIFAYEDLRLPGEKAVASALNLDFEPEKGDGLEIAALNNLVDQLVIENSHLLPVVK
jgi:hypothetical protein